MLQRHVQKPPAVNINEIIKGIEMMGTAFSNMQFELNQTAIEVFTQCGDRLVVVLVILLILFTKIAIFKFRQFYRQANWQERMPERHY